MSHDRYAMLDGAYVLGSLDDDERREFEQHLAGCAECRDAVAELRGVLPFLQAGDESNLGTPEEQALPGSVLTGLLARERRAARRRRLIAGAAVAAAACLVALLVMVRPGSSSSTLAAERPMVPVAASPISARVGLTPTAWGTRIDLTCSYRSGAGPASGYGYALAVRGPDGRVRRLGTWRLSPGRTVTFTTGTALRPDQIRAVDLVENDGTALLELARS